MKLNVIIASTRPNRIGPFVADWFHRFAVEHGAFESELVDLATFNLPVFDEPAHPALGNYAHEHTKRWSESVRAADAFVFVMPEYNYGPPPSLVNALTFVYREWNFAPAGFVSYGGVSGGTRAVQAVKSTVSTLKMVPIPEGVAIPMVPAQIVDSAFKANDLNVTAARTMLDQLKIWAGALQQLRTTVR
jgi:NAD(P)H-dependent FMN reductase